MRKSKPKANTFVFKNKYLNLKGFIECLSEILEMPVHYEMSAYEKSRILCNQLF